MPIPAEMIWAMFDRSNSTVERVYVWVGDEASIISWYDEIQRARVAGMTWQRHYAQEEIVEYPDVSEPMVLPRAMFAGWRVVTMRGTSCTLLRWAVNQPVWR